MNRFNCSLREMHGRAVCMNSVLGCCEQLRGDTPHLRVREPAIVCIAREARRACLRYKHRAIYTVVRRRKMGRFLMLQGLLCQWTFLSAYKVAGHECDNIIKWLRTMHQVYGAGCTLTKTSLYLVKNRRTFAVLFRLTEQEVWSVRQERSGRTEPGDYSTCKFNRPTVKLF